MSEIVHTQLLGKKNTHNAYYNRALIQRCVSDVGSHCACGLQDASKHLDPWTCHWKSRLPLICFCIPFSEFGPRLSKALRKHRTTLSVIIWTSSPLALCTLKIQNILKL